MVGSVVARVLLSIGFAVVTINGVEAGIGFLKDALVDSVNALPGEVLGLFLLGGGGVAINVIFAAITFRVTIWSATKAVRVLGVKA